MEKIDITSFLTKMVQNGPRIPSGANCVLFVYADHDGAGFDDSVCRAACNQTKLLDGSHGNGGTYDIASTYVNFNYAVNGAFDYFNDCAFKLISCAELHTFISLNCFDYLMRDAGTLYTPTPRFATEKCCRNGKMCEMIQNSMKRG